MWLYSTFWEQHNDFISYRGLRATRQARDDYHNRSLIELHVFRISVGITLISTCKRTGCNEQSAINKYQGASWNCCKHFQHFYSSQGQTEDLVAMLTERLFDPVQSNRPVIRGYEQLPVTSKNKLWGQQQKPPQSKIHLCAQYTEYVKLEPNGLCWNSVLMNMELTFRRNNRTLFHVTHLRYSAGGGLPLKWTKAVWRCGLLNHGVAKYLSQRDRKMIQENYR